MNGITMRLRSGIKTPSADGVIPQPEVVESPRKTATPKTNTSSAKSNNASSSNPTASPAKRGRPPKKRDPSPLKRKAASPVDEDEEKAEQEVEQVDSDEDGFGDAQLEGALSASEDDSDSEHSGNEAGSDGEDDDEEGFEDPDDDDALHSDDIPSDDDGSLKVPPLEPGQEPGLDPPNANQEDNDLRNYRVETDANGNEKYVYDEIDPVYDSDDTDANEPANTIGNIDLKFYDSYPHIGYDINGKKIMRPAAGEALDALLDSIEVPKGWTGLTDPATGKPLNLSRDELELIKKIQTNELPDGYDPYPVCTCAAQTR